MTPQKIYLKKRPHNCGLKLITSSDPLNDGALLHFAPLAYSSDLKNREHAYDADSSVGRFSSI